MDTSFYTRPEATAERQDFYGRLGQLNAAPLWEVLGEIVRSDPRTACQPAFWRYQDLRPLILESGRIIAAEVAERRVLILENPGYRGASRITQSVYAGMQLVLPGEIAPSHRHTASALRFILEGEGGHTTVNGERIPMRPGDLILTPSWTWHDHGNPGEQSVVWLDGLDIPIVNFFDTSFAEHGPDNVQPVHPSGAAPVTFPYAEARVALDRLRRSGPAHPKHGVKMPYLNPSGGPPLATLGAWLQLLPAGFHGTPHASTDATVYCCAEGSGRSQVGDCSFSWQEHDVFVVPSWCPVSHEAGPESVLFSFSDRPAQQALGIWRES